jgi:polyisoprenoid-binding protein YceI
MNMGKWIIDPDHSVAAFVIRHMMVASVRGQFNRLSGAIQFDPSDIVNSSVDAVIDVRGIYTGIQKRDDHLRSADFFDVVNHPEISFRSDKAKITGSKCFNVTGDLMIHGVTQAVTLEVEYSEPEKSPYGGEITMGFAAATKINREDFGLTWNETLESGGILVGKEVQIYIDIEADLST